MRDNRRARAVVAVALVAFFLGTAPAPSLAAPAAQTIAIEGVELFPDLSPAHRPGPVEYEQTPPVGGPHAQIWLNCGVYLTPVPSEFAVHSLEHGAVWITYQGGLDADSVAALRAYTRGQPYVLVTPWPDDPAYVGPIVASAWGAQLRLDDARDPRLLAFIARYADAPDGPEPGAPCRGGVGSPQ